MQRAVRSVAWCAGRVSYSTQAMQSKRKALLLFCMELVFSGIGLPGLWRVLRLNNGAV